MSSTLTASRSSADLPPGTLVAGFRLDRVIGRGPRATVYEATQLSLDRRVAFKLLHDRGTSERVRRLRWPEHQGAVSLFGSGDSEHGPWLAMRLVPGGTLETCRAPLDQVAAALDAAHRAGIVHGAVAARNVLVADGRAYLSDFGLAPGEPTVADDRDALRRLLAEHPPPRPRPRGRVLAVAAAVAGLAVLVLVLATGGGDGTDGGEAPASPAGTAPLGSRLAPGAVESVDCNGRSPGGASPSCTVSQRTLGGRPVVVPADGTIASWAVRGARGTLALQVLRGREGGFIDVGRSADATIAGAGVHLEPAHLAVAAGDRIALLVTPGSAIGVRPASSGAATERWFGPLLEPARRPDRGVGTGFDDELLLRVDVSREAGVDPIEPLRGPAAAGAPPGRRQATRDVEVGGDEFRTAAVVVLDGAVAVDLLDGSQRVARTPVRGANGRGRLEALRTARGSVRVLWRNTDGRRVARRFAVSAGALRPAGPTS
jgi:hypothetical protein